MKNSEVIVVIGANPTENHPVAATFFKNAQKKGSKLIVMDPRGQSLKKQADYMLQFTPGSDVALLNSLMHVILKEKLYDEKYINKHTLGFEKLEEHLKDYSPELMSEICGIEKDTLYEVARTFAKAENAIIFW